MFPLISVAEGSVLFWPSVKATDVCSYNTFEEMKKGELGRKKMKSVSRCDWHHTARGIIKEKE